MINDKNKLLYDLDKVLCGRTMMDSRNIPEPFRSQFLEAMKGQGIPTSGPNIHHAKDWLEWASGNWRWGDWPII